MIETRRLSSFASRGGARAGADVRDDAGPLASGKKTWYWTSASTKSLGKDPQGKVFFQSSVWDTSLPKGQAGVEKYRAALVKWVREPKAGSDGTIVDLVETVVGGGPGVGDSVIALPDELSPTSARSPSSSTDTSDAADAVVWFAGLGLAGVVVGSIFLSKKR